MCYNNQAGFRTGQAGHMSRGLHNLNICLVTFFVFYGRVGLHSSTTEGCPGASTCLNRALIIRYNRQGVQCLRCRSPPARRASTTTRTPYREWNSLTWWTSTTSPEWLPFLFNLIQDVRHKTSSSLVCGICHSCHCNELCVCVCVRVCARYFIAK